MYIGHLFQIQVVLMVSASGVELASGQILQWPATNQVFSPYRHQTRRLHIHHFVQFHILSQLDRIRDEKTMLQKIFFEILPYIFIIRIF